MTLLLSSAQIFKPSDKFSVKVYQVPYEPGFETRSVMPKDQNDTTHQMSGSEKLNNMAEFHANFCRSMLDWKGMKDLKPDIIVGDSHFLCSGIIKDFFNVKLVLVCPSALTQCMLPIFKNPNPLSYVPQPFAGLDDRMSFPERMLNVVGFLLANIIGRVYMFPALDKVKQKYHIRPEVSAVEALVEAELVLVQTHFALDYPRPLTPGT